MFKQRRPGWRLSDLSVLEQRQIATENDDNHTYIERNVEACLNAGREG